MVFFLSLNFKSKGNLLVRTCIQARRASNNNCEVDMMHNATSTTALVGAIALCMAKAKQAHACTA